MKGLSRSLVLCVAAAVAAAAEPEARAQEPDLTQVLSRAEAYVEAYERRFSLLVAEEHYVQEIHRPSAAAVGGGFLTRNNPGGGGFAAGGGGGVTQRLVLRSDYLLVRLDAGSGWMPFRDVFDVNGKAVRDREDRLVKLFIDRPTDSSFDQADQIMADSTRHNIGAVARTINIPTLGLLFLHPDIRPRFAFTRHGTEAVDGREAWVLDYKETRRPTLIKTSNGRDLALTGRIWVDPSNGVILRTNMTAADPVVRATVTVTFREDTSLDFWVPAQMEEHYKAARDINDIHGMATYTNYRKFQVSTGEDLRKPPGGDDAR